MNLCYEVAGQGDPLVLIHGLGSSARDWQYQIDFFVPFYKVIAPDLRGYGRSDKPRGPYSVSLFARDIAELITSLSIAPCHLAGISLGGMVALQLAVDSPEIVRSLTLVNCGSEFIVKGIKDWLNVLQRSLIVGWSVTDQLEGIRCLVLVVSAENDYIRFEQKAPLLDRIRGAEWAIIRESRHATTVDQPEAFNRVLLDFIARQS